MLAPTIASPESAGMSKSALDRIETHLKSRYIDAGRFPGTQLAGLSPRQGGAQRGAGPCRRRAQGSRQGRHHLPHLFDDQADHGGGLHDAGRGRQGRARRARPQIHPGMEGPRRVRRRQRAELHDEAAGAADADRRSPASHLGADLRPAAAQQCRRRLSRGQNRGHGAGENTRRHDQGPRASSRWSSRPERPGIIRCPSTCSAISSAGFRASRSTSF